MTRAAIQHAAPFFVWLGVMFIGSLMHLTPNTASEDIETVAFLTDAQLYTLKTVLAGSSGSVRRSPICMSAGACARSAN